MIFILDTHTFLWFITDNSMLSKTALQKIENINHERMISVASLWEIAIKISLGKLELSEAFDDFIPQQLKQNFINILPITTQHLTEVTHLPFHHRDPFDRLIISQSIVENIPVISIDNKFDMYKIDRIW